jgi:hypothetical protein
MSSFVILISSIENESFELPLNRIFFFGFINLFDFTLPFFVTTILDTLPKPSVKKFQLADLELSTNV